MLSTITTINPINPIIPINPITPFKFDRRPHRALSNGSAHHRPLPHI